MREQFEKLPEIARMIYTYDVLFVNGMYECSNLEIRGYINGAWYAFQDQQKKIGSIRDLAQSELDRWNKDKESDQIAKGITIAFNSIIYHLKHIKDFVK